MTQECSGGSVGKGRNQSFHSQSLLLILRTSKVLDRSLMVVCLRILLVLSLTGDQQFSSSFYSSVATKCFAKGFFIPSSIINYQRIHSLLWQIVSMTTFNGVDCRSKSMDLTLSPDKKTMMDFLAGYGKYWTGRTVEDTTHYRVSDSLKQINDFAANSNDSLINIIESFFPLLFCC